MQYIAARECKYMSMLDISLSILVSSISRAPRAQPDRNDCLTPEPRQHWQGCGKLLPNVESFAVTDLFSLKRFEVERTDLTQQLSLARSSLA